MTDQKLNDLLHGITLETILTELVEQYGWEEMGRTIRIRCFNHDPSIKSSLQFLRKTPWARKKVEALYLRYKRKKLKETMRASAEQSIRGHGPETAAVSPEQEEPS